MLRIFIGYDSREPIAFHVLAHSIMTRASCPVSITPLVQPQLRAAGLYTRERGRFESTEFSLTRFLVPYLSDYEGWSIYMDCDMLVLDDLDKLKDICYTDQAVWVCQHEYIPTTEMKMDGQVQTVYPRKNWSSCMVFNNTLCKDLTVDFVNIATGMELHRFLWTKNELIGSLPLEWNWLVGEYPKNPEAKILHYTLGGPWFRDYQFCDHAQDWFQEYDKMVGSLNMPKHEASFEDQYGNSFIKII